MAVSMDWTLEIHHIDVGGGDATAIVVKDSDGKFISKVLIDAGAEGAGYTRLETYVTKYLKDKEPDKTTVDFDYIIASHYHNDHFDGFSSCKFSFKYYIDIGGHTNFDPINGTGLTSITPSFIKYRDYIEKNVNERKASRIEIPFINKDNSKKKDGPLQIDLGVGTNIRLTCYCANGILANGTNVLKMQKNEANSKGIDPNDLSLAFVLEWDDFRYFTAGDLTGDTKFQLYYNVEKPLVDYLTGTGGPLKGKPITVLKVNHHGSEYSSYDTKDDGSDTFFKALQPEVVVVPCNIRKKVPSKKFLDMANTYCNAKKAPLLFVNLLYYVKQNERYKGIENIKGSKDLHSNLDYVKETTTISNLGTNAVIIRRTSRSTSVDEEMLDEKDVRIKLDGKDYEIIIKKGEISQAELQKAAKRISTYILSIPIDPEYIDGITTGFQLQAKDLAEWLNDDSNLSLKLGADFIKEWFPALEGQESALTSKMQDLFNRGYKRQTYPVGGGTYFAPQSDKLNLDERQTLYFLLLDNKYQPDLNKKWNGNWRPQDAWNVGEDPYELVPPDEEKIGEDRTGDLAPPLKRTKTE